jgi:simple sugar transport system ATP-binding protein
LVHSYRTQDVSIEKIAEDMIGERNIGGLRKAEYTGSKIDILASTQWSAERNDKAIVDIDLRVRSGEIVGIAGVEGNGQDVLLDSLFQPTRMRGVRGQMRVLGVDLSRMEPAQIRQLPIAIFPEDRLRLGAVAEMSAWENFILGYQRKLSWWIDPFAERKKTLQAMQDFDVRPQLPDMLFSGFSGGNQQKLVVARELNRNPQLIVAAHPTRGVDIGAIRMIHQNLLERRASGCGVLLITTELDELLELADRIHVIFRGRFVAHFERKDFQVQLIGQAMGGKTL